MNKTEIPRDHNQIWITPNVITPAGCKKLIDIHLDAKKIKVDYLQGNDINPPEDLPADATFKYDAHDGKEISIVRGDEFTEAMKVVNSVIPPHIDFSTINYASILRYTEGGFFAPHKDQADMGDFATAIFTLNEDYLGGKFTVEPGITIDRCQGTMVAFNNSTEVWHQVEPIYSGERYVFAIWFGREGNDV